MNEAKPRNVLEDKISHSFITHTNLEHNKEITVFSI